VPQLWGIYLWIQSSTVFVIWLLVNIELANWTDWDIPYTTLFLFIHVLQWLSDQRHWFSRSPHSRTNFHLDRTDFVNNVSLCFLAFAVDVTAVIRQVAVVGLNDNGTADSKAQLALFCICFFVTIIRCIYATQGYQLIPEDSDDSLQSITTQVNGRCKTKKNKNKRRIPKARLSAHATLLDADPDGD
jgi:hypothetical protein